jgi:hypothetical protein
MFNAWSDMPAEKMTPDMAKTQGVIGSFGMKSFSCKINVIPLAIVTAPATVVAVEIAGAYRVAKLTVSGSDKGSGGLCLDPRFPMILPGARFSGMV